MKTDKDSREGSIQDPLGDQLPRRGNWLTKFLARSLMSLFGWRIEGKIPNLPKMLMIGAPHTSNWDFLLTLGTIYSLGVKVCWMAKNSVFQNPFGGIFHALGGISVDRSSSQGYVDQIVEEFNRNERFLLAITPEGTRKKAERWKSGFYYIALGARVPILFIGFDYEHKTVRIGPALTPSGDYEADLAIIKRHYAQIRGKFPHQF